MYLERKKHIATFYLKHTDFSRIQIIYHFNFSELAKNILSPDGNVVKKIFNINNV